MKVQVQELSSIEKSLSIEVEPAVVAKELDQAYAQLSRTVKVAGFRSGKIPRRILEQRFRLQVEQEVSQRVMARSFVDAVQNNQIEAVGDPTVTKGAKLEAGQPFAFTAKVEVKPQVTAKDYKGLPLKKADVEVTEAAVDERIEAMRQQMATVTKIEDRDVAQSGDIAVIDFVSTIDGKGYPNDKGEGVMMELAPGDLVKGFMPQLEGLKIGAQKEFDYAFPADYDVEEAKGKIAHFVVTLKELHKKELPALDDSLAEKARSGVHTLKEMRELTKKGMERAKQRTADTDHRNALIEGLVAKNTFDVPMAMVERAIMSMLEGMATMLARSGMDPRTANLDWGKLREDFRPRAEAEVRGRLLFEAVSRQEKIEVSEEDFEKKLESISEETHNPLSQVRKAYREPKSREALMSQVREEKTIAFLKSAATYS